MGSKKGLTVPGGIFLEWIKSIGKEKELDGSEPIMVSIDEAACLFKNDYFRYDENELVKTVKEFLDSGFPREIIVHSFRLNGPDPQFKRALEILDMKQYRELMWS